MFDEFKTRIKELNKKYVRVYDHTKKHFNINDKLFMIYKNEPIEVIITDISKPKNPGDYIFYYVRNLNVSKAELFWENLKFYLWYYFLHYLKIKQFKFSGKLGPGHGCKLGLGEDLFETKEEALFDHFCHCIHADLVDLEYLIKNKENNNG